MDQVEHVYQAMYEFHTGKCGIEKVMKLMEEAGYDTAQGYLLHRILHGVVYTSFEPNIKL